MAPTNPTNQLSPSDEEVREITQILGDRLIELFIQLSDGAPSVCEKNNRDGRGEVRRFNGLIQSMLAFYAEDFGETAARHLESWANNEAGNRGLSWEQISTEPIDERDSSRKHEYDAGHPWHYLARGDGCPPPALADIPPAHCDGTFAGKLPRHPSKRRAKLEELLKEEATHLAGFETRYSDLIARGVNALGEYDRTIAYGGDAELALASSVALRVNHIRHSRGRVQWLSSQMGPGIKFDTPPAHSQVETSASSFHKNTTGVPGSGQRTHRDRT